MKTRCEIHPASVVVVSFDDLVAVIGHQPDDWVLDALTNIMHGVLGAHLIGVSYNDEAQTFRVAVTNVYQASMLVEAWEGVINTFMEEQG